MSNGLNRMAVFILGVVIILSALDCLYVYT